MHATNGASAVAATTPALDDASRKVFVGPVLSVWLASAGFGLTTGLEALAEADTIIVSGYEDYCRLPRPSDCSRHRPTVFDF